MPRSARGRHVCLSVCLSACLSARVTVAAVVLMCPLGTGIGPIGLNVTAPPMMHRRRINPILRFTTDDRTDDRTSPFNFCHLALYALYANQIGIHSSKYIISVGVFRGHWPAKIPLFEILNTYRYVTDSRLRMCLLFHATAQCSNLWDGGGSTPTHLIQTSSGPHIQAPQPYKFLGRCIRTPHHRSFGTYNPSTATTYKYVALASCLNWVIFLKRIKWSLLNLEEYVYVYVCTCEPWIMGTEFHGNSHVENTGIEKECNNHPSNYPVIAPLICPRFVPSACQWLSPIMYINCIDIGRRSPRPPTIQPGANLYFMHQGS